MSELKDIKYILMRKQKGEISNEQTNDEIKELIKTNGYYNGDDLKTAYELGRKNQENNIQSDDNIYDEFVNDFDGFVQFISMNGFFSKDDINRWYMIGNTNKQTETDGDVVKEMCMHAFNYYLLTNFN